MFTGDPIMASTARYRLLHRSTVINIRGDSYRLKEKRKAMRIPDDCDQHSWLIAITVPV